MIFDREAEITDIGEMVQVGGVAASARIATSDVPDIQQGDQMQVRGATYNVIDPEPDGTGMTILRLGL